MGYKSQRQVWNSHVRISGAEICFPQDISQEKILPCKSTSPPSTTNVDNTLTPLCPPSPQLLQPGADEKSTASVLPPDILVWTQTAYWRLPIKSRWLVSTLNSGKFSDLWLRVVGGSLINERARERAAVPVGSWVLMLTLNNGKLRPLHKSSSLNWSFKKTSTFSQNNDSPHECRKHLKFMLFVRRFND